jgi:S1-C subfamily serine protease
MIDSHGRVIGMVSLKGNIEGTAFAIPAKVLREVIQRVIKAE